jgi:hypothetical protein
MIEQPQPQPQQDTFVPTSERVKNLERYAAKGVIPAYLKNKEGRWIYSYMKKTDAISLGYRIQKIRLAGKLFEIGQL